METQAATKPGEPRTTESAATLQFRTATDFAPTATGTDRAFRVLSSLKKKQHSNPAEASSSIGRRPHRSPALRLHLTRPGSPRRQRGREPPLAPGSGCPKREQREKEPPPPGAAGGRAHQLRSPWGRGAAATAAPGPPRLPPRSARREAAPSARPGAATAPSPAAAHTGSPGRPRRAPQAPQGPPSAARRGGRKREHGKSPPPTVHRRK